MGKWVAALTISVSLTGCSVLAPPVMTGQRLSNPLTAATEVRRLEEGLVTAWSSRDFAFMERILAPEFVLASSGGPQGTTFNNRSGWLKNARGMAQLPYQARVMDVVVAGDRAVATLEARWRRESFLTDTWVKRNGQWQLIFRHSAPRHSAKVVDTAQR